MWKDLRKKFKRLPRVIRNPYLPALLLFGGWMIFFDENNLVRQYRKYAALSDLKEKKNYYLLQISETNKELAELTTNPITQEKFAREHFRMKRDNEDVFVIVHTK